MYEKHNRKKRLTVVGDDVARLTDLQELWLWGNALTRVPARLDRLVALRMLHVHGNRLETLPDAVGKLTDLQRLDLTVNRLTRLPATFIHSRTKPCGFDQTHEPG